MTVESTPLNRHNNTARTGRTLALTVVVCGALLAGCSEPASDSFWLTVEAEKAISKDAKQFAADKAADAAGGDAAVAAAFAACLQPLDRASSESNLNRCEGEATQLAASRGQDGAAANHAAQTIRLQVSEFAARRRAHYEARIEQIAEETR